MVTGVLPVALEEATKTIQAFLLTGKEYTCVMTLHGDVDEKDIRTSLEEFVTRKRKIYSISDFEVDGRQVLFRVSCQAGTYIRKLVFDVGEVLKVGAHMRALRRVRAGAFTEEQSCTLYDVLRASQADPAEREALLRKIVRPMEDAFEYVPKIVIRDSAVSAICHGAELAVPGVVRLSDNIRPGSSVAIFTLKGELVALSRASMDSRQVLDEEHGIAAKTVRVVMPAETYPKMWRKTAQAEVKA